MYPYLWIFVERPAEVTLSFGPQFVIQVQIQRRNKKRHFVGQRKGKDELFNGLAKGPFISIAALGAASSS